MTEDYKKEIEDLLDYLQPLIKGYDEALVRKAAEFCVGHHGTQLRESGEPYFTHPFEVARIIATMKLDVDAAITALLHDTLEDTDVTYQVIATEFSENIAKLVDGVTKLSKIEVQSANVRQAENLRKLFFAMSEDIRVLLIKLADRMHNMRTLQHVKSLSKRRRIAKETMDIFAPMAERIGAHNFKTELQDLAFGILHPEFRDSITSRLIFLKQSDQPLDQKIVKYIENLMHHSGLGEAQVSGREKTPVSIWFKMQKKNVNFEQLSDIIAFRIIVDTIPECYQALGIVHSHFQMIPGEFQDYISTPKENGYQSIHTIVIGPTAHKIEIQIRTKEMHDIAEHGLTAHWVYKQGAEFQAEGKKFRWIRELINILESSNESEDILENTKMQIYYDQVFCFTPKGQLIALPRGATAVDFAYAVHGKVGDHCIGAKVNGRISPISTILENGDQIEILISKNHKPSPAWLEFIVTPKAKSGVKKFIKEQRKIEYLDLGRQIFNKLLQGESCILDSSLTNKLIESFNVKDIDELMVELAAGNVKKKEIVKIIGQNKNTLQKVSEKLNFWKKIKKSKEAEISKISVNGLVPGMAIHYAKCCHPIPGDNVVGVVNTGKGITMHVKDCDNVSNIAEQDLLTNLSWSDEGKHKEFFVSRLYIILLNKPGALNSLTNIIAKNDADITNIKVVNRSKDFFEFLIDLNVYNHDHLQNILTNVRNHREVYSVERIKK